MTSSNPYRLTSELARDLLRSGETPEVVLECNVDERDHVQISRVGTPGAGLQARGLLRAHEGGHTARVFLAAPELRRLAAGLLNVADAIDGKTPLSFFDPEAPSAEEPER